VAYAQNLTAALASNGDLSQLAALIVDLLVAALPAVAYAQNLTAALASNGDLSQLAALIGGQQSLLQSLGSASNITLLAPNNAALGTFLNSTQGKSLASNQGAIAALLSYHVLNGTYFASQIQNTSAFIPTLLTNATYANVTGGQRVQALLAHNNVTLISGLEQNSTVVTANLNFTGGTIHVINKVLTVPTNVSEAFIDGGLTAAYGALNATNLLNTIDGLKDITIFAPSNDGFADIASVLSNATTSSLVSTLEYHVVNGTVPLYSTSLSNTTVKSLQGNDLTIRVQNGSVFVNNAKVIVPDFLVAGGVVHVIDQVLNPANPSATPSNGTGTVAFQGASSASTVPFTSGVPGPSQSVGGGAPAATSTSHKAAAAPAQTAGVMGAAAFLGAAGLLIL